MGNPLREMIITAGQRLQDYLESYKQSKEVQVEEPAILNALTEEDAAWEKLQKLFSEVAERQNLVQKLQVSMGSNWQILRLALSLGSANLVVKWGCFLRFWCEQLLVLSCKH
jgi:hypothetical protein